MKDLNVRLLLLPVCGLVLFAIGLFIPEQVTARYIFIFLAVAITLLFYFITLVHVIRHLLKGNSKKLFWLVAIICLPVIGNVIYMIFLETANRRQEPHGVW